jgi:nucleotide-binding universal stress UspA family protein
MMQPIQDDYTIVVGVNFSDESSFALDCALRLAAPQAAAVVHAIHVTPRTTSWNDVAPDAFPQTVAGARHELEQWALHTRLMQVLETHCRSRWDGLDHVGPRDRLRIRLRWGKPADEMARFAEECGAALVVVGTSAHRRGVARLLLGSVAEEVVRTAPCAVFVARRRQRGCVTLPLAAMT